MAINVNTVYRTVLLLLNKEQRGYMTPTEFNSIANQVQLEIFEQYFSDLNQQLRVPQTDVDYANRVKSIDEKLAIFKTFGAGVYVAAAGTVPTHFTLPTIDAFGSTSPFYQIGAIVYKPTIGYPSEIQRLDKTEFYNIQKSDLTAPSVYSPVYLYENNKIFISPSSIVSDLEVNYIRKPTPITWGFTSGSLGQYVYSSSSSIDFELMSSEQTTVILKVLFYAGVIIEDNTVIQVAAQQVQSQENNQKT
tara:strand:- start:7528 stop:8271 length:744 start_codon:yes stop_codon:yes gene_type:complete